MDTITPTEKQADSKNIPEGIKGKKSDTIKIISFLALGVVIGLIVALLFFLLFLKDANAD